MDAAAAVVLAMTIAFGSFFFCSSAAVGEITPAASAAKNDRGAELISPRFFQTAL